MMRKISLMVFTMLIILTFTFNVYAANPPLDGNYKVELTFTGGTGRITAISPTDLTVSGGKITAKITLTSSNYTYMIVNGTKYNNTAAAGENSTFIIPISALDTEINVTACTVAMSTPKEIDYTIKLSSQGTIGKDKGANQNSNKNKNENTTKNPVNSDTNSKNTNAKDTKDTKDNSTTESPKTGEGEASKVDNGITNSSNNTEKTPNENDTKEDKKDSAEIPNDKELPKESAQLQSSPPSSNSNLSKIIIGIIVIITFVVIGILLKKRKISNK